MENITSAEYLSDGYIQVKANGKTFSVPNDMKNGDRAALDVWASKDGNSITAYESDDLTLDDVRIERKLCINEILGYFNAVHPVDLPEGTTQAQWNKYLTDLRYLPATITLTGVKTHAAMVALFPTKPS